MQNGVHASLPALDAIIGITAASERLWEIVDTTVAPLQITGGQYMILRILKRALPNACTRSEILGQVIGKKADLTRQLDGLERLGFIERVRTQEDRRVVFSKITDSGISALEQVEPLFRAMLQRLMESLAPEEWATMAMLCRKIVAVE